MVDEKWSARFRTHDEIRSRGAIGNLNDGIEINTQGVRTRLIAWPGNGFQTESVHVLTLAPGEESARRMGADRAWRHRPLPAHAVLQGRQVSDASLRDARDKIEHTRLRPLQRFRIAI